MKKIFVSLTILVLVAGVTFYLKGRQYQARRELVKKECDINRSRLGAKIEVAEEVARLRAAGLDVRESLEPSGNQQISISSSDLDRAQVSCNVEISSGSILSVH